MTEVTCECGCGVSVTGATRRGPRRFVSGHNIRKIERTPAYRAAIGAGQRTAWATKRQRMPVGALRHNANGYVVVKVLEGAGRWETEHKLVMEAAIGRSLRPDEQVHHINGIRDDNDTANLFLCKSQAQHLAAERSMSEAFRTLLGAGFARFNRETGRYEAVLRGHR